MPPSDPGATARASVASNTVDAVLAQDAGDGIRDVVVLPPQQALTALHDRHPAAEATEHLAELQADVPAAQHQQMLRDGVQLHDRR